MKGLGAGVPGSDLIHQIVSAWKKHDVHNKICAKRCAGVLLHMAPPHQLASLPFVSLDKC